MGLPGSRHDVEYKPKTIRWKVKECAVFRLLRGNCDIAAIQNRRKAGLKPGLFKGKRAQSGVTVLLGGKNKNGWGAEALHP
jgi:hypothetical protein